MCFFHFYVFSITNNSKVMVLGKRYDPEADEMVVKVREIEAKSSKVSAVRQTCVTL